jgi:hypothetical protein
LGTPEFNAISRTRLRDDPESIGALTNPAQREGDIRRGDEEIGMTDDQIMRARQQLGEEEYETIREALLAQRNPAEGLLIVYPISPYSQPRTNSRKRLALFEDPSTAAPVIGLALGFPRSESAATVEYLVNEPAAEVQAE